MKEEDFDTSRSANWLVGISIFLLLLAVLVLSLGGLSAILSWLPP